MYFRTVDEWKAECIRKEPGSCYALMHAEESFLWEMEQWIREQWGALFSQDLWSRCSFSAEKKISEYEWNEVLETCSFSPRLVTVSHAEKLSPSFFKKFITYLKHPQPAITVLFFFCSEGLSSASVSSCRKKIQEMHQQGGGVCLIEQVRQERERGAEQYLLQLSKSDGKEIPLHLVEAIVKRVGAQTARISQEWEKLSILMGNRKTVEEKDILFLHREKEDERGWYRDFLEESFSRGLKRLEQVLTEGCEPFTLLPGMRNLFQNSLNVLYEQKRGEPVQKRYLRFAESMGEEKLEKGLIHLYHLEVALKNSDVACRPGLCTAAFTEIFF